MDTTPRTRALLCFPPTDQIGQAVIRRLKDLVVPGSGLHVAGVAATLDEACHLADDIGPDLLITRVGPYRFEPDAVSRAVRRMATIKRVAALGEMDTNSALRAWDAGASSLWSETTDALSIASDLYRLCDAMHAQAMPSIIRSGKTTVTLQGIAGERGTVRRLEATDIIFVAHRIEGERKSLYIKTSNEAFETGSISCSELEQQLPADGFLRPHRGTLLSLRAVRALRDTSTSPHGPLHKGLSVQLKDGSWHRVSRRQAAEVRCQLRPFAVAFSGPNTLGW